MMKISASSSSSSSTFRTCLLFLARERPLSGLLFFLAVLFDVGFSCNHSSSSSTGLGRDLVLCLGLASGWSSSSSVWGSAVMPLTSKDVPRLLEVEPLSVEVEGTGTRLLDVDGPADDSPLLGFGCARVLCDLLGRCCWVSSSSSCKYAAESHLAPPSFNGFTPNLVCDHLGPKASWSTKSADRGVKTGGEIGRLTSRF